jgi:CubicO group peptidase (beta-lactamase class C family)
LPSSGRLPVSSGSIFKAGEGFSYKNIGRLSYSNAESVGMSTNRLEELDNIVLSGIANRAFPGGQVLVARKGKVIYHKNYGSLSYDNIEPVTDETLYDIASVTKVASTLQAVMLLNERQTIDLNQKASFYLPELIGTNKENLYVSDILMHQAGLASFIPFWAKTKHGGGFKSEYYAFARSDTFNLEVRQGLYVSQATPDSLWKWLKESPLNGRYDNSNGGFRYLYSDLGLIILQKVIEKVTNQPLNVFVEQNLYEPLGMGKTLYNPLKEYDKLQIAPTENDGAFRSYQLQGTVHDPTAALMGGVAGNAGIFSTANDLAILFQMNLNHGQYANRKYLLPQTVSHFSQNYSNKSHRGLGWDKPKMDEEKPIVSELAPFSSYGHSGYTGTVAWIDPEHDLIFIFLCNRVYPQISNKITTLKVRKRLHDAVYRAIVYI